MTDILDQVKSTFKQATDSTSEYFSDFKAEDITATFNKVKDSTTELADSFINSDFVSYVKTTFKDLSSNIQDNVKEYICDSNIENDVKTAGSLDDSGDSSNTEL